MKFNDLGKFFEYDINRWNRTTIDCFKIGCWCEKCHIPHFKETKGKCHVKAAVLELARRYGVPK